MRKCSVDFSTAFSYENAESGLGTAFSSENAVSDLNTAFSSDNAILDIGTVFSGEKCCVESIIKDFRQANIGGGGPTQKKSKKSKSISGILGWVLTFFDPKF